MRMFEQHTKSTALHSVMSGCPLTLQHWSLSSLLGNFISLPASQWVSRLLIYRFRSPDKSNMQIMWEKRDARAGNEWESVVCGQTREGAPMYLHALCTTWNE